jgi:hypothetical protein
VGWIPESTVLVVLTVFTTKQGTRARGRGRANNRGLQEVGGLYFGSELLDQVGKCGPPEAAGYEERTDQSAQ